MHPYSQRIPLITPAGAKWLQAIEEHTHAPRFTHPGIDRLTPAGLQRAKNFATLIAAEPPRWHPNQLPPWVKDFVADCYRDVPFYRRNAPLPTRWADVPTCGRADLSREPWAFVPDSQPVDALTVYNTSGTTGHPLAILTHANTLALYLPLLAEALRQHHVALPSGPGQTAIALVCFQHSTYTYATVSPVLEQAGFVKVNLNPSEWRDPADRAAFLEACDPAVYTGDPLAFTELQTLPLRTRPRALVSTAMTLLPGLQQTLSAHFGCPVLDLYSLNETGPVALAQGNAYTLLQPRLYVEILDSADQPLPPGERGEVVVTGGFNPLLPLVRYRTGDHAALEYVGQQPRLVNFEGRAPVRFRTVAGRWLNNIDITMALRPLALPQFALHQAADGALTLKVLRNTADLPQLRTSLLALFGATQALDIVELDTLGDKVVQYTADSVQPEVGG